MLQRLAPLAHTTLGKPLGLLSLVVLNRGREKLDELLVKQTHAWAREAAVLVDDGSQRPVLHLPHAPDHTPRTMRSLRAMHQDRVIPHICQMKSRTSSD